MNQLQFINRIAATLSLLFIYISSSAQSNYALSFDGTDDYVSTSSYVVPATGNFTVELWVYSTTYSGYREFVSQGSVGTAFYIGTTNGTGVIRCGDYWGSTGVTLPLNRWVHIALVKSGASATLFLDGVQKANLGSGYSISPAGTLFQIGAQYGGAGEFFSGTIEEVRVWNVARTQSEIKSNMYNNDLFSSSAGLVACYHFNEGSGTNAANSCSNTSGIDGTLTNGVSWTGSPIQFGANALSFDGVDDYAVSTATFNLNMDNSSFTIEAWINSANASANTMTERILAQWGPTWQTGSYHLVCTDTYINFNFNGSSTGSCSYNVNWQDGNWHHVAGVFDISTHMLYLYYDGIQKAAVSTAGNVPGALNTSLYIGGSPSVSGSFASASIDEVRVWNVARSQTDIQANMYTEISHPFSNLGTVPRLYYTFNQGIAGGTNTGVTTVSEQYLQAHGNGTLVNFDMSGGSSNFTVQNSDIIVLPLKWLAFTAHRQNNAVRLDWRTASEINTSSFLIEHSTDARNWKTIGSISAWGDRDKTHDYNYLHRAAANGVNYYRIRQNDIDGKYSYSKILSIDVLRKEKTFQLLTNPVSAKTLQLKINQEAVISLTSRSGKLIWTKAFSPGIYSVGLESIPKGIYIINDGNNGENLVVQ